MWLRGGAAAGLAAMMAATPVLGQSAGTVELGGFGRYTSFGESRQLDDAIGFGGRLGVFLSRRFSIEGDISYSSLDVPEDSEMSYIPIHGRILFNQPIGQRVDFLLGAGGVFNRYHADDTDVGVGGLVGTRIYLSDRVALRLDATADHMPASWNSNEIKLPHGPIDPESSVEWADRTNIGFQAGLSLVFGRRPPVVAAAPAPPPPPPPPPATPPPPPPPPNNTAAAMAILTERVHFDFDQYNIRPDAQAVLDRKVPILRANPNVRILVEGHCDERGSLEYNDALGMRRANAIKEYLVSQGIAESRIDVVSFGETRPLVNASNEEAWAQNRRGEFVVVAGGENLVLPSSE